MKSQKNFIYFLLLAFFLVKAEASLQYINTETLKSWYEEEKPMIVVDARKDGWFDHKTLPDAIRIPHNLSDEEILKRLPQDKNTLLVVYCGGPDCPASKYLYKKLQSLGYCNLYEYSEGISTWEEEGFPTYQYK